MRGRPPKEDDFEIVQKACTLEVERGSRDVLIKTLYLSCDPYMRERMKGVRSYVEPFTLGEVGHFIPSLLACISGPGLALKKHVYP